MEHLYLPMDPHRVTAQKINTDIITTVTISHLKQSVVQCHSIWMIHNYLQTDPSHIFSLYISPTTNNYLLFLILCHTIHAADTAIKPKECDIWGSQDTEDVDISLLGCSAVWAYQHSRETYCLYFQPLVSACIPMWSYNPQDQLRNNVHAFTTWDQ
jgi:hypothetical protein